MRRSDCFGYRCPALAVFTFLAIASCIPVERQQESPSRPDSVLGSAIDAETLRRARQHSPLPALPASPTNRWADDERAAILGQFLFFDRRLSANGEVSCSTCHDPELSFADGKQLAQGLEVGPRHTPSLWNVAYNRWFFWDGRADTLWSQALGPLESEVEHGMSRVAIAALIRQDPDLRGAYEAVFGALPHSERPEDIDRLFVNVGKAMEAYERKLISRSSRFDRFIAEEESGSSEVNAALTSSELRGLSLFVGAANCRLCHAGPLFSDREFHDTRVPLLDGHRPPDSGRYGGIRSLLGAEFRGAGPFGDDPEHSMPEPVLRGETWGEFKTPTLRNVAKTGPYMHQGQLESLRDVVHFYSTLENARPPHDHGEVTMVPLELSASEIDDIVAFLGTLTDESIDAELLKPLASPLIH